MKRMFLTFLAALCCTVYNTAMAEDIYLTSESAVGTIGALAGREAIVVDLGEPLGKVAVATMNVGATGLADGGTQFVVTDALDQKMNGLTRGWYVPSKEELTALKDHLKASTTMTGLEWQVTDKATLYLPAYEVPLIGYCGAYVSNAADNSLLGFVFDGSGYLLECAVTTVDSPESVGWSVVRPFHKLPEVENSRIYYSTTDNKKIEFVGPTVSRFGANVIGNEYDEVKGEGCFTFDDEVRSIENFAFYGGNVLTAITLPGSVTSIGDNAFSQCSALTAITLPDGVTSIGDKAFSQCSALTSITIPDGVMSIGVMAFYECCSLTVITLPSALTNLGCWAFADCDYLKYAIFKGATPPPFDEQYDGGPFPNSGVEVYADGTRLLAPSEEAVTSYTAVGYSHVYVASVVMEGGRSQALDDIENAMNGVVLTPDDAAFVAACQTKIEEATDLETIEQELDKALAVINAQKEKDADKPYFALGEERYALQKGAYGYVCDWTQEDNFVFADGVMYQSAYDVDIDTPGSIVYRRVLPEGVWQCWYEPFEVKVDTETFDAAEVAGILTNAQGETIVAFKKLEDGDRMLANTIYVIRAKEGHGSLTVHSIWPSLHQATAMELTIQSAYEDFTLTGNYMPVEAGDWYTLNKAGAFQKMGEGTFLKPQRFWLTITPRTDCPYGHGAADLNSIAIGVLGDDDTGMEGTMADGSAADTIVDLMGRRVADIQRGEVYIVNGKKYMAK